MHSKSFALAAVAALVLATHPASAQQKNCTFPLGWWESKGLMPFFINPKGPSPTTDCDFQLWSWSAFVNVMQTDPATKLPRLLTLPTFDDLASGDLKRAAVGPRTLMLKPRDQKPKSISEFQQAGSRGVLVDQNGRAVYYAT